MLFSTLFGANTYFVAPVPATVTGANDGLSLTGTTARLGNAVGAVGDPAQLLEAREIALKTFLLTLFQSAADRVQFGNVLYFGGTAAIGVRVLGDTNTGLRPVVIAEDSVKALGTTFAALDIYPNGPVAELIFDGTNVGDEGKYRIEDLGTGFSITSVFSGLLWSMIVNGFSPFLQYDLINDVVFVGASPVPSDCKFLVVGGIVGGVTVNDKTVNYQLLLIEDSNKHFTNRGAGAAVTFTLPTPADLSSSTKGFPVYEFEVNAAQTVNVIGDASQTIRIAAAISPGGGAATSAVVGSVMRLQCLSTTEFIATSIVGVWTV